MSQVAPIEIVKQFADDNQDVLLWIDDIESFAKYNTTEKYYEVLQHDHMANIMNDYIFLNTEKSSSLQNIHNSYLAFLKFKCKKRIPTIYCSDMQIEDRYNYLAFKDELLNLDTFTWEELGSDKFVFHKVPFTHDEIKTATAPRWQQFLDEVLVMEDDTTKPDKDLQKLLQLMFGYCLANTIKAHKAFFLFGKTRAGKGVISSILQTIMGGEKFVSNLKLGTLTNDPFSLEGLVGKKANIAGEDESSQISADTFKSLVVGDSVDANRKFKTHISFTPKAKMIVSANKFLRFKYIDDAIRERLITIPFHKTVPEAERDFDLTKKLHAELPGIMNWALEGLKELMDRDWRFPIPDASKKAMKLIEAEVSNAVMFFTENFEVDTTLEHYMTRQDMYAKYKQWCYDTGHKGVMSDITFFKELHSCEDFVKSSARKRFEDKDKKVNYITIKPDSYLDYEDF